MSSPAVYAVSLDKDAKVYRIVYLLWFLVLFDPAKFIFYMVPAARPLTWVIELLLFWCTFKYILYPVKKGYPALTAFMLLLLFGVFLTFFDGNFGESRKVLRIFYQYWLLGLVTLTFCNTPERTQTLLKIYFAYFLYFGIWGLISLEFSPINDADPGLRKLIYWHKDLDNRDGFGPLMVAGIIYTIYYYQARESTKSFSLTLASLFALVSTFIGFITSFGRGAFLAFLFAGSIMWFRSRRKVFILAGIASVIILFFLVAPQIFQRYTTSMQTITQQGMQEGTGQDRYFIWSVAWRQFEAHPFFGVGPGNFGVATQDVVSPKEQIGAYSKANLWGRSVHSAPFSILSEFGLLGVAVALYLCVDFFRTNRYIRFAALRDMNGYPQGYLMAISLALNTVLISYLVCSIFYEILYTQFIWNVLILNRLVYLTCKENVLLQPGLNFDKQQKPI